MDGFGLRIYFSCDSDVSIFWDSVFFGCRFWNLFFGWMTLFSFICNVGGDGDGVSCGFGGHWGFDGNH